MGKKKTKETEPTKVTVAEYKISMHCNACERTVAEAISKCKGVEQFTTDLNKHRVEVKGRIDPVKLLKKLKKKTGKRVEIVGTKDKDDEEGAKAKDSDLIPVAVLNPLIYGNEYCGLKNEALMIFSDDNPNSCSIM